MHKAKVVGAGSYTPETILTNSDLEKVVDTSDAWITRRTGIKERRIATGGMVTSEMAARAARQALEQSDVEAKDLDLVVVGTVTPDRQFPSCACLLQEKIGARKAASMDVSAGCSGFIYALSVANNAIRCGEAEHALVVGAEVLSGVTNWSDRGTCVLLGDGAGAVVLSRTDEDTGIKAVNLRSDGSFGHLLYSVDKLGLQEPAMEIVPGVCEQKPFYLVMDGKPLFKKAVECLEEITRWTLDKAQVKVEELALMVPHQANIRIINALAQRLGLAEDKVYTTIERYGNTSSASIPIALAEAVAGGRLAPRDKLLMVTFGAGLTWGASLVEWSI
ncbi:MAG: ketoacyl-ACP synthase III [Desulfarculaceae bacterium]|nr:ketoacyl-ACP synthase III [Desulfarculaceae bacterium]MCF8048026.1 ketoacyl-ACP synthase III [Desulfarculaceae bacterium]MCF8097832.1 ketoacyl-ACP synthase III [Desulfarculaceae bacterium]MCF8123637.1 ketoacyl-ACP synthase III [Desulfarculaceae bacterium]